MMEQTPRCWAEIDLSALRHNVAVLRSLAGGAEIIAVVKANAYGHGLAEVARAIARGVKLFAVANLREALELRATLPDAPVISLGPALPEERAIFAAERIIATVSSYEEAGAYAKLSSGEPVLLNVEIDTGMGRMGCAEAWAVQTIKSVAALSGVRLHSISTHLPSADTDKEFTRAQLDRFSSLVRQIRAEVPGDYKVHALPTAGLLGFPESAFDFVRAGLALYGISTVPQQQHLFRPALSLKTRVVLLRELAPGAGVSYGRTFVAQRAMRVATLGAGYADGYMRSLSNTGAAVLIRGRRCSALGRITMDLMVVDVSEVPEVADGDEAVLIGRQGSEEVTAVELAKRAGTIPWEIFTSIGARVPRVYF